MNPSSISERKRKTLLHATYLEMDEEDEGFSNIL
jgi:hypothetical protein